MSVDQLDGCLNSLVVAKTLSSLVLQEKHLEMLDIHRPEDQKYFALSHKCSPLLGSLVPDVVIDERGRPCAVAVAFLPICAIPGIEILQSLQCKIFQRTLISNEMLLFWLYVYIYVYDGIAHVYVHCTYTCAIPTGK